MTHTEDF